MTHAELITVASDWLRENYYPVATLTEPKGLHLSEEPDIWAMDAHGRTYVIECKATQSDATANINKPHAANGKGCGIYRWLCCLDGVIEPGPARLTDWGLLHVGPELRQVRVCELIPAPRRQIDLHADLYLASIWASQHSGTNAMRVKAKGKVHPTAGMVATYLQINGAAYASEVVRFADLPFKAGTFKKTADEIADAARDGRIPGVGVENRGGRPWLFLVNDASTLAQIKV